MWAQRSVYVSMLFPASEGAAERQGTWVEHCSSSRTQGTTTSASSQAWVASWLHALPIPPPPSNPSPPSNPPRPPLRVTSPLPA